MADNHNSTNNENENEIDRLSKASLEACYLDSLLAVIEDIFEDLDSICDTSREVAVLVRPKVRIGIDITYMAQDKLGSLKLLTDGVERSLFRSERLATTQPAGNA